ncbi:Trypsin-like peptidase domain-containing protein [Pelagirhabdus alkalitolerans]|uniref:Trypsin-like peptidase domain-containing protein n=1 Tax=Pelagirhabdus alkalitolerans TaxID=1612202 RepID=A0A1G6N688_9BACI|nr:S1C family serine protease [Pelagirhabdus alkalitolerans]SDC63340.1 Trypsin-like peptidase domain-containing protein [Pelagirhabdus alkalitolerans]
MSSSKKDDMIDKDLYEDLEPEEIKAILDEERRSKTKEKETPDQKKDPTFPRWVFGLIVFAVLLNGVAIFPRTFSIPAIDFLVTSHQLSQDETIQSHKESVVGVDTSEGRGTGFGISESGYVVTNYHVIEDETSVTVHYPEEGLFNGDIVKIKPEHDLALIKVDGDDLPYLPLAEHISDYSSPQSITFIGNPLNFTGIANQGKWIASSTATSLETDVMLLDAPVYRGNSGSPVINEEGQVIGVIYATRRDEEWGRVGLAIPVDHVHTLRESQ